MLAIVIICRFVQDWRGLVKNAASYPLVETLLPLNKAGAG